MDQSKTSSNVNIISKNMVHESTELAIDHQNWKRTQNGDWSKLHVDKNWSH